jgi:phosphoserine phosphatase
MALVTLDVDGTLVRSTVFRAAAVGLDLVEEVDFYDDLYVRGVISLETTFLAEYDLFLDRPVDEVQAATREGPWLPDIGEVVDELRDEGLEVWIVTDQPDWGVAVLADAGLTEGVYTRTRRWGDRIGPVEEQVFAKAPALADALDAAGVDPADVCHVGNGHNDVPVFEQVGGAVAFNPDDEQVAGAADATVRGDRLAGILDAVRSWAGDR